MDKSRNKRGLGGAVTALTLGFLALPAAHAATTAYQTAVLADNPYLYYRLGESSGTSATDTSGNSRTGTYTNSPTLGQPGAAILGDTAVGFDGTNDYVATTNATSFGSSLDGSSYEFVFSTTSNARVRLFGTYNTGSTTAIDIVLNENGVGNATLTNGVRLYIRNEAGTDLGATFTNASLFDGGFHQLVLTYDSVNRVTAYVDGVAQTITYVDSDAPGTFANFGFAPTLGARNVRGTVGSFFPGTIDEFSMYDSVLSETQVGAHFAAIAVPETSVALLGGLGMLGLLRRRRGA